MTFVWLIVGAVAVVVVLILAAVRYSANSVRDLPDAATALRAIDIEAFRTLTDSADEQYLRSMLSRRAYREAHRQRVRALMAYAANAFHNAGILMRVAGFAAEADGSLSEVVSRLADHALRVRTRSALLLASLCIAYVTPQLPELSARTAAGYIEMKQLFAEYASLAQPKLASRLISAL